MPKKVEEQSALLTVCNLYSEQSESSTKLDFEQDLDAEDFETLQEVCKEENVSYKDFAKSSMSSAFKKYRKQSENKPDFEVMSLEDLEGIMTSGKGRTYKGLAEARIAKVVELVSDRNDNQPEKSSKWYISPSLIAKLTGSNRPAINSFFTSHKTMIDDHNSKHGLRELDNRKGVGKNTVESLKMNLGLMAEG